MNTTHEEKKATKLLLQKCRVYLYDNFHKFSDDNKIKIALTLLSKSMPTQIEGGGSETKVIIVRDNGNKTQAIPGQVCIQQEPLPSNGIQLGNREVNVRNLAGNDILRADTE